MRRQLGVDGRRNPWSGPRELKGTRQKERLRKQRRGRGGWSATRFGSHLLSASLPKGTIYQRREQERSTKARRRRPERSASSHRSLTGAPSPPHPSRIYSLTPLVSFCSTNPPFFPSPAPDYYRFSFPINHSSWQLISTCF